jgi:magnesium transporter
MSLKTFLIKKPETQTPISQKEIEKIISNKDGILWIDIENLQKEEAEILRKTFKLHPVTIEDCSIPQEAPKIELFPNYLLINIHGIKYDINNKEIELSELNIIVGSNYIITVHQESLRTIELNIERVANRPYAYSQGTDQLLHSILDLLIDRYIPLLEKWDKAIEQLEDRVLAGKDMETALDDILDIKRQLIEIRRIIAPQKAIIGRLARRDFPIISDNVGIYFRDVYDHIVSIYENVEIQRELISAIFEAYLSVSSNRMTEISNQTNIIMQRLTIISTIFLPLTFIASLYGMNFNNMPEIKYKYGYPLICCLMLIIGLIMFYYFKKKKWF